MQSRRKLTSARNIQLGMPNRRLPASPSPYGKSPTPKNRRILSHRSLRRSNLTQTADKQIEKTLKEVFLHVRNDDIYEELQNYRIQGLVRLSVDGEFSRKDLVVISKIQEFYQQYNSFCTHNQAHCSSTTWIILTNAVNGKQIQNQFNSTYEPITFYFLKDVQDIVNYIQFKQQIQNKVDKDLSFFSKIINFDAYTNKYACILEFGANIQLFQPSENNELWLISKKKLSNLKIKGYQPYYLGENSINLQKISLIQLTDSKILYVLSVQDFELYLNSVRIKQFQEEISQQFLKKALFIQQQKKYYQKVIPNYLSNQIIINLQGHSQQIADLFRRQFRYVIKCKNLILTDCHVYSIQKNVPINQQITSIRSHFEALKNIKDKQQIDQDSLYSSTLITNFSEQFKQFKSQFKTYSHRQITQFSLFLRQVQHNSSHLVILPMEEYTQQRQKSLQQTQLLKHVNFEVYLLYGNQFIFRSKNVKYTFLKKDQLLAKIKLILQNYFSPIEDHLDLQNLSDYKSDIQHNRCVLRADTFSTPNLYYFPNHKTALIICVPKSIPFHTLIDRSQQPYSLLTYSNIKQPNQMLKYLPQDYFAAIITSQKMTTMQSGQNFEYIFLSELTEKAVREEIDKLIAKFQLVKRYGSIGKKKKIQPTLILYNHLNEKQVNTIKRMNQLFQNTKVMTINKKQFKIIKKSYAVSDKIELYQIGKPQIAFAKRLKTPLEIFKIYMSPQVCSLQFTAQILEFSIKQLFLREIISRNKSNRMRSMRQLSLTRSLSPKGKSILQKQCFLTENGLVMVESKAVNKLNKKQKFNDSFELINLCLLHLQRGNQMLAVISEEEFFALKDELNVYGRQIIWIVLVKDDGKCIVRQANIIFTKDQQFQHVLGVIIEAYRSFKAKKFQIKEKGDISLINNNQQNKIILVEIRQNQTQSHLTENNQDENQFTLFFGQKIKCFMMKNLQNAFVFNDKAHLNSIINQLLSLNVLNVAQNQCIQIICDQRNKRFLQQTLKIIQEDRFIIIVFEHISELITYSSPYKSLLVLQKQNCNINVILIDPSEFFEQAKTVFTCITQKLIYYYLQLQTVFEIMSFFKEK